MPEPRDPEKDNLPSSSDSTSAEGVDSYKKEELDGDHIAHSSRSSSDAESSHHSIHLEPIGASQLERAVTTDSGIASHHVGDPELSYIRTATSVASHASRIPGFEVDFVADDPQDPKNWPLWYKGVIIGAVSFGTWTVVLYSTSYTSSLPGMMDEFHESNETIATLGVTTYLVGLACGSLITAPLSELYGRRPVYVISLFIFSILVLPCAMAHSLAEILIVRFFGYVLSFPRPIFEPGLLNS